LFKKECRAEFISASHLAGMRHVCEPPVCGIPKQVREDGKLKTGYTRAIYSKILNSFKRILALFIA